MNRFVISIAIIFATLFFSVNDANADVNSGSTSSSAVPIRLRKNNPNNPNKPSNRCPAMPIYGTYDGYTLSIDVVADDEAATYELVVTTAGTQTVGQYTAVELNQGVAVPPLQPATIGLTTPAGAVYVGEITD